MKSLIILCAVFSLHLLVVQCFSPTSYFSDSDAAYIRQSVLSTQKSDGSFNSNIADTHFAASTLSAIGSEIPHKEKICDQANALLGKADSDAESIFHAANVLSIAGCTVGQVDQGVAGKLSKAITSSHLKKIYQGLAGAHILSSKKAIEFDRSKFHGVVAKISELLQNDGTFKGGIGDVAEGTPLNAGLAYHCLAFLKRHYTLDDEEEETLENVVGQVEELFNLAEEDENTLSFTDPNSLFNLRATSLVLTGINALAGAIDGVDVSEDVVSHLAEYFVHNKHVSNNEDAFYLLRALKTIASNNFKHTPLVVTLPKSSILASGVKEDAFVKVHVTDIFGRFATKSSLYISKAHPVTDPAAVILQNYEARPVSDAEDETLYSFNFLATKPDQGLYTFEFSVIPVDKTSSYSAVDNVLRNIKVVVAAEVTHFGILVADSIAEAGDADLLHGVTYPNKLEETLRANKFQHIFMNFRLRSGNKPITVHQAFFIFTHQETQNEVVFPAQREGKKYKLAINLGEKEAAFGSRSGKYSVKLVVGDSFIQNPFVWEVASVQLNFGKHSVAAESVNTETGSRPEIHHQFRAPEKRPPVQVSMTFTGLVLAVPFLILLVGLAKVGANISNFPLSGMSALYSLAFVGSIVAILGLYVLYWFQLTMVQTLSYLSVLGLFAIISGQQALRWRAQARTPHAKKD